MALPDSEEVLIVTGASSPLGDVVAPMLVRQFQRVYGVVRSDEAAGRVQAFGIDPITCDLEGNSTPRISATHLLHMAGIRFAPAAIRLAEEAGVSQLLVISSASAVAPRHPNREWVLESEAMISSARPDASILRPTMIFGSPRDRNIRRLRSALRRLPGVPRFTGGGQIMPVFADDVAAAISESFSRHLVGTRPVGGPAPIYFGDLIDAVAELDSLRRLPGSVPVPWLSALASIVGPGRSKAVHALQMLANSRTVPSPQAAGFHYSPTSLGDALCIAFQRYS